MRASKKLLLGLAVLAVSVTGIQAEDECKVCRNDPLGLSDECRDVRSDDELRLNLSIRHERDDLAVAPGIDRDTLPLGKKYIYLEHDGTRLQWSTNSVDWNLFNHCKGVSIQPDISRFTFNFGFAMRVRQIVPLERIGRANWLKGVWEGPEITKIFVRLLPCDVNAHKKAYKNRKISMCPIYWFEGLDACGLLWRPGMFLKVEWNYGTLQSSKSLGDDSDWKFVGGWGTNEFDPARDGKTQFFRIKPLDEDAFKVFFIDLDEDIIREEKQVSNIPVLAPPLDLK